jgi:hypothetical protein
VHKAFTELISRCSKAQTAPCNCGSISYNDLGEYFIQVSNSDKSITLLDKNKAEVSTKQNFPQSFTLTFLDSNLATNRYSISSSTPQTIVLDKEGLLLDRGSGSYSINTEITYPLTKFFWMKENTIAIAPLASRQQNFIGYQPGKTCS